MPISPLISAAAAPAVAPSRRIWRLSPATLLLVAFGAEVSLFTFGRNAWGPFISPLLLMAAGFGVGILAWRTHQRAGLTSTLLAPNVSLPTDRLAWLVVAVVTLIWLWTESHSLHRLFDRNPPERGVSDIILALRVYARRWRWAETVYRDLTPAIGYYLPAGYLPGTWFPFVVADVAGLDYRWLAYAVLLGAIGAYWARLARAGRGPVAFTVVVPALLPLGLLSLSRQHDPSIFGLTIETLHVGYYLLLGVALLTGSLPLRAVALTLCLLSRYSFALWLPLYAALVWWHEGPRRALTLGALVAALVGGCYIWPYLRHDWAWLPRTMAYYKTSALGEWRHFEGPTMPIHLFNGLGLAPYFYPAEGLPGVALPDARLLGAIGRIQLAQLLGLSALLVALAGWWWGRAGHRGRAAHSVGADADARFFALVSLKFYLVVFYATVQIPYAYLVLVSVFFSVLLVGLARRRPVVARPAISALS